MPPFLKLYVDCCYASASVCPSTLLFWSTVRLLHRDRFSFMRSRCGGCRLPTPCPSQPRPSSGCGRRGRGRQGQPWRASIKHKISEQRRGWPLAGGGPAWPSSADKVLQLLHVFGPIVTLIASVSVWSRALQASSAPSISRACDCVCRCSPAHAAHCLAGCGIT